MNFYVSNSPFHGTSDWAALIIKSHEQKKYIYHSHSRFYLRPEKEFYCHKMSSFVSYRFFRNSARVTVKKLSLLKITEIFQEKASKARAIDLSPKKAISLLTNKLEQSFLDKKQLYYSGIKGKILKILSKVFPSFSFESSLTSQKITQAYLNLTSIENSLSSFTEVRRTFTIPALNNCKTPIFTASLHNLQAIGRMAIFSSKTFTVVWIPPKKFLSKVDRHFWLHPDEESLPWLLNKMAAIANQNLSERFSPLLLEYVDEEEFINYEGRHRALAAFFLKIPFIPVATNCSEKLIK